MYRLGGGGHLGDSLFLQRRATIMDKYAQLRLTHPAQHSSWLRVQPLGRKDWKICLDWIARGLEMIQPQALVVPLSD